MPIWIWLVTFALRCGMLDRKGELADRGLCAENRQCNQPHQEEPERYDRTKRTEKNGPNRTAGMGERNL